MYLLVFITLMISLIGIYTQVIFLQTARINAKQNTVAQEMLMWHYTASDLAKNAISATTLKANGQVGCSLSGPIGSLAACVDGNGGALSVLSSSLPDCSTLSTPAYCKIGLPPGYNTSYTFYTIVYQVHPVGGNYENYVVTYVAPPTLSSTNPPPGYISLPVIGGGTTQIGLTLSDLVTQFTHTQRLPLVSYGTVYNQVLQSRASVDGASFLFQVPLNSVIKDGSLAIIAMPDQPYCPTGIYSYATGVCQ